MLLIMKRLKMSSISTGNTEHSLSKYRMLDLAAYNLLEFDLWGCLGLRRRLKKSCTMETEHSCE
jgi:hypothetical protein